MEAASDWTPLHRGLYDSDREGWEIKDGWAREGKKAKQYPILWNERGKGCLVREISYAWPVEMPKTEADTSSVLSST